jgi:hypothetical protein
MKRREFITAFGGAAAVLLLACSASVRAQVESVDRSANGQPGKDIQVGVYVNIRADCTLGPLPTIRLSVPPEHGNVTVRKAQFSVTNYKQCLAVQAPAYVAIYRSQPNFFGVDVLTLEVKYPTRTEMQRISVTVGSSSPGQRT